MESKTNMLADISEFERICCNAIKNKWRDWLGITGLAEKNEELKAVERRRAKIETMLDEVNIMAEDLEDTHHGDKIAKLRRLFDKAQDDVVLDYIERELVGLSMAFIEDM